MPVVFVGHTDRNTRNQIPISTYSQMGAGHIFNRPASSLLGVSGAIDTSQTWERYAHLSAV
ncbi:hypothetical protein EYF80_016404 [Liparis tanakae]|uniref:Uncharacterized protein n=1 Tax=Liparis tanakae TaxID=230148 RepID=A0A4Z2I6K6_9TELE|nr:hypothetical protein EYF80_016404 [Liparis tanakae]